MARTPMLKASTLPAEQQLAKIPASNKISDRARYEAQALYVTHPDGITIDAVAETDLILGYGVAIDTVRRWAKADDWVGKRKVVLEQFGERVKEELQKQLYSRIAQVRTQQLDTIQTLKDDLIAKALDAAPRSAEGAAKVVIDLLKHELELTAGIAQELIPTNSGVGAIEPRNSLSEEEILEAAQIVLRARRQGGRAPTITVQAVRKDQADESTPEAPGGTAGSPVD